MEITAELEAQLRDHPEDVDSHLVYADWLQSRGDPQGELIAIQHALATKPTAALKREQSAWFARHFKKPTRVELTWTRGFVRDMTIKRLGPSDVEPTLELLRHPACRFLDKLAIAEQRSSTWIARLVEAASQNVLDLAVSSADTFESTAIPSFVERMPRLRKLQVYANSIAMPVAIRSPTLEHLAVGQYLGQALDLAATTPALRSLLLHGLEIRTSMLDAIFDGRWPLEELGLFVRGAKRTRLLVQRAMRTSKLWPRLVAAGIEWDSGDLASDHAAVAKIARSFGTRRILPSPFWSGTHLYNVGQALRECGRLADAFVCFERAVVLEPKDPENWLEHGNVLAAQERNTECLASYRRAIELDPKHAAAHYNIATQHRDTGRPKEGLSMITQACKLDPDDAAAWHVRGQLERMVGKPAKKSLDRALQLYTKAVDENPDDAESWFQIACVHELLGKRKLCLDRLAEAIALDPSFKTTARDDIDFVGLRDDPAFVALVR